MAVSVARKTLPHEWQRFLPIVIAIAFSGALMAAQGVLFLRIVRASTLYVSQSDGDLWIGLPGTRSVELGRTLSADAVTKLHSAAGIDHIERFLLGSGDWQSTHDSRGVNVSVVGIDTGTGALGLAHIIPPALRNRLRKPGTVVIDAADSAKLSARIGDVVEINGHEAQVVGFIDGLRGLDVVNVVGSLETAGALDQRLPIDGGATYFLCSVQSRHDQAVIIDRVKSDAHGQKPRLEIWHAADLAEMSATYLLLESGAGVAFVFATLIALMVGAMTISLALFIGVAIRQYAILKMLGVPLRSLKSIVMEHTAWVGIAGLALIACDGLVIAGVTAAHRVSFDLRPIVVLLASLALLIIAMIVCVISVRRLHDARPATLSR